MFSFFNNGITQTIPTKVIDLTSVIQLVKNNPNKDRISEIRKLRANNNHNYKTEKKKLPIITVNAVVKKRGFDNPENVEFQSGYIYFDIDKNTLEEVKNLKQEFISKYKDMVSFVCYSSSMGGISVFVKYDGVTISNKEEFKVLRKYIIENHFPELSSEIDSNAEDFGRVWFVSYDPDCFFNINNVIQIPNDFFTKSNTEKKEEVKCLSQYNILAPKTITLNHALVSKLSNIKNIDYSTTRENDGFWSSIHWNTQVRVENAVLDLKEVDYYKLFLPRIIKDGSKRKIFTSLFINFVMINNELPIERAVSFLRYVNNNLTGFHGMKENDFKKFVAGLIKSLHEKKLKFHPKKKFVHFNKDCSLDKTTKMKVANLVNGAVKKNISILKIKKGKNELLEKKIKITQVAVAKQSGMSRSTVSKYWNSELIDLKKMEEELNKKYL